MVTRLLMMSCRQAFDYFLRYRLLMLMISSLFDATALPRLRCFSLPLLHFDDYHYFLRFSLRLSL